MSATREHWLPVLDFEGAYEVSDLGRIRSLDREVVDARGVKKRLKGKVLTPGRDGGGYLQVCLRSSGIGSYRKVHRVVLEAFVGPRPDGMECRHLNGVQDDCRLVNLAWGTHSENQYDQSSHGTHTAANKTHCPQGHPYSGANLYRARGVGPRRCRSCARACTRASGRDIDWRVLADEIFLEVSGES